MSYLSDGQYRIFNAEFANQDADLLFGQPRSIIGGFFNNSNTFNMVWNLENVGSKVNQITLRSAAPSANRAYASVDNTTIAPGLHGSPNATIWTLVPARGREGYWILAPSVLPSEVVWSLSGGQDLAPIELAPMVGGNPSQLWIFHPQVEKVGEGDATKGLNKLD